MSRRAIRYLGIHAGRRPWLYLFVALALTVVALVVARSRFHVEMDVAALLPRDSEVAEATRKPLSDFVGYGFLLCVLEVKRDAEQSVADAPAEFLLSIRDEVEKSLSDQRFFRVATQEDSNPLTLPGGDAAQAATFTEAQFDTLEAMTRPERLRARLDELAASVAKGAPTEGLREDPLGVVSVFQPHRLSVGSTLPPGIDGSGALSRDGRMMLLVLWPAQSSSDLIFARNLKQFVGETRDGLLRRNPQWQRNLDIHFSGLHVENAEGTSDVKSDIAWTSLLSFASVMILFFVAFRQPEALLFVAVPLVMGVIWTLGVTSLAIERITQITLTFAAILIGLGLDFSIHLYNRFLEEIRGGNNVEKALREAMHHTGPSIVAGAITTGFGFFGLALTRFVGFRELGLFGGIGIIMSLVAMILTLPPLMVIFAHRSGRMRAPVATLGLKKITFTVTSYPRMTVAAGLSIAVFLGLHARNLSFNDDFRTLSQPSDSYLNMQRRIEKAFQLPSNQVFIVTEDAKLDAALAKNDKIYDRLMLEDVRYQFLGIESLREIHPASTTQLDNLRRVAQLPLEDIRTRLAEWQRNNGDVPADIFEPTLDRLEALQHDARDLIERRQAPIAYGTTDDAAFQQAVQHYVYHDDRRDTYRAITRLYPRPAQWEEQVPQEFLANIRRDLTPEPLVLGNAMFAQELKSIIITDLTVVVLMIFASLVLYLLFYFRDAQKAFLAIGPVLFALLSTLGVMHLLGMRLDYLNIIAIPLILGMSVDSSIHLLARFYEGNRRSMREAVERTGRAIVITNLTTIFGFGSLGVASFQGIREIGILSIIGTVGTLFATLILLPAVLQLSDPACRYSGGAGDEIG